MYKRIKGKKFGRKTDQRKAFIRSLAANLILAEKIQTTKIRARQAANFVEKMITKAKAGDLASRRLLMAALPQKAALKLLAVLAPRFKDRKGGYTRVIKLGLRAKDGAPLAIAELIDRPENDLTPKTKPAAKGKSKNKKEKNISKKEANPAVNEEKAKS